MKQKILLLLLSLLLLSMTSSRSWLLQVSAEPGTDRRTARNAQQVFIDLEKLGYYRGIIRQLLQLETRVAEPQPEAGLTSLACPERSQIFVNSVKPQRLQSKNEGGAETGGGSAAQVAFAQSRCRISRALQVVKLRCEERQHCRLQASPATGQQPPQADPYDLSSCEQLLPHLQISYTCEPSIRSRFLCADTYSTVSCDDHRHRLLILDAVLTDRYVFQDQRCPNTANPSQGARRCPDESAFGEVKRQCEGRTECSVAALRGAPAPGCARPNLLLLFACVPKQGFDQVTRDRLAKEQQKSSSSSPTLVGGEVEEAVREPGGVSGTVPPASQGSGDSRRPPAGTGGSQPASSPTADPPHNDAPHPPEDTPLLLLSQLSPRHLILLGCAGGGALLLILLGIIGCLATRRCLRNRRRREEEHLARVHLSKQIPPPATCLTIPPAAEALLKLPVPPGHPHHHLHPNSASSCSGSGGSGAPTISVCFSHLGGGGSSSVDGSGSGSGGVPGGGCTALDRHSTSATSTFLSGAGGAGGSLPSPRDSVATYSLQQHQCASSVLEELEGSGGGGGVGGGGGPRQLGMI